MDFVSLLGTHLLVCQLSIHLLVWGDMNHSLGLIARDMSYYGISYGNFIPCWCGATSPLSSIFAPWCQYSCLGGWSSHGLQRPSYWVLLTGRTGGLTCSGPDNKDSLIGGGNGVGNLALYLRGRSSSSLWPRNEVTPVTAAYKVEYMELPAWVTLVATVLTAVERASRKLISWSCLSMDVYFMMGVWSFKSSRPISSKQESLLLEDILENLQKHNQVLMLNVLSLPNV